jgi:hypothetical protein
MDINKIKARALAYLNENTGHWYRSLHIADGITYEPAANFIEALSPAAVLELIAEVERLRAAGSEPDAEPLKWESTTLFYTRFITDSRYQRLRPSFQKWYKPICDNCGTAPAAGTEKDAVGEKMAAWLYGLSKSALPYPSWATKCAELSRQWDAVSGSGAKAGKEPAAAPTNNELSK